MGLFDAFTPERLIRAMGVDPEKLAGFIAGIETELAGFKAGFATVVGHFNGKLSGVEARLSAIEAKLDRLLAVPEKPANGRIASLPAPEKEAKPNVAKQ